MIYMNEKMKAMISQNSQEDIEFHIETVINYIVSRIKVINE